MWKLSNDRDSKGELFLMSNALSEKEIINLSYERLFGKLIATQDNIAIIMAEKRIELSRQLFKEWQLQFFFLFKIFSWI